MTTTPATSMPASLRSFSDAAADAVARAIAGLHREAQRERELRDAQFAARSAELDARLVSVSEVERRLAERLATVKDGEPGPAGDPGRSIAVEDVEPLVQSKADQIAGDLARMLPEMITAAVAVLPPAEKGKDADPELVASLVAETAERILAGWERPRDGNSVTAEELAPLVAERVQQAVSALPVPKDGEPGKSVEPEEVQRLVDLAVEARATAIAVERDFAPEDVAENIALAVRMMAEAPQTREAQAINVFSNVAMPEMKAPETVINLSVPRPGAERVTVTEHSADGRIKSYVKTPVGEA